MEEPVADEPEAMPLPALTPPSIGSTTRTRFARRGVVTVNAAPMLRLTGCCTVRRHLNLTRAVSAWQQEELDYEKELSRVSSLDATSFASFGRFVADYFPVRGQCASMCHDGHVDSVSVVCACHRCSRSCLL